MHQQAEAESKGRNCDYAISEGHGNLHCQQLPFTSDHQQSQTTEALQGSTRPKLMGDYANRVNDGSSKAGPTPLMCC